ncbi:MAG TPA: tetratricopeptide repeat protein [Candidatus Cybelea sp.]|jgi:tetratricopeptide (TPR) repeat protein|nr:tetratricopeptide repeat protein [Candidatus Cybelea sp.]
MLRPGAIAALTAAVAVGAAWPWLGAHSAQAGAVAPAPIPTDYLGRNATVAFDELQARRDPDDQITRRMLGAEYMQRFRETGDLNDVDRALAVATVSLRLQPQGNAAALGVIASGDLAFHRFDAALRAERAAVDAMPFDDGARAQTASILMELGHYAEAKEILDRPREQDPNPTWLSIRARYDELTGNLTGARVVMAQATASIDRLTAVGAYTRSWYHTREAQLAFEAGDGSAAEREFGEALRLFPENAQALLFLAKLYRAHGDWPRAFAAARRSAELYPLPQALGYEADAQRALGDEAGARRTDALISAEQRLFNAQGVNDRLLAIYYAEHREHLGSALTAARADLAKRGDEIYADDTMAWVLAAMGRWREARHYALRAARFGTQDPELQSHAGIIAWHAGARDEALTRLRSALAADPHFHPFYASDARAYL